jgi:hypothetical protein
MNHADASEALERAGFKWAGTTAQWMSIKGNRWNVHIREYWLGRVECRVWIIPSHLIESLHGKVADEIRRLNKQRVGIALGEAKIHHVMEVCA